MTTATIIPLTPTIGAEVHGVDTGTVSRTTGLADQLTKALIDHHVLVFRNQNIDREQHKAFGRIFGELHVHPSKRGPDAKGDPEIFTVKSDANTAKNNGGRWHADVTCDDIPPAASVLYLKEAPDNGGDTLFTNMHTAFESLSSPMQEMLRGLTAFHDGLQDLRWYGYEPKPGFEYPTTTHPVVVPHPDTGRPTLFVNEAFTSHIVELSTRESDALLAMLFAHIAQSPLHQVRVKWEPGTMVMWDNRATQHYAVFDYFPQVRRGERVTVAGRARP